MVESLTVPAVILLFLSGSALLISRNWRASIVALALQYLGITLLVALSWPDAQASVKLVAGWMAGAVLGLALINLSGGTEPEERLSNSSLLFRGLLALLVLLVAYSLADALVAWLPMTELQAAGGLLLIGLGLLHLGLTSLPLRVILGLLTVLGGFEILYAAVEGSILLTGLLAAITLGLAMVGAYLMAAPSLEEAEG